MSPTRARGAGSLRLVARIAAFQAAEDGSKPSGSTNATVPLRLTAGCRTLNAVIVVRIHEGEPIHSQPCRCSSAARAALSYGEGRLFKSTRRHHFFATSPLPPILAHQFLRTNPAVVQRPERLIVAQETAVRPRLPGTNSERLQHGDIDRGVA
jgi:hypothetical protein